MKALMVKSLQSLHPADDAAGALLRNIGQGEVVGIEIRRPRNLKFHRLFWALMTLVWENMDNPDYSCVEDLVTNVKVATGHYEKQFMHVDGKQYVVLIPKSISFAKMDQAQFEGFFERACDWVIQNVLPGVTSTQLREEIEIMTGIRD